MMSRHGSQVPLVPIPKLKSWELALAPKRNHLESFLNGFYKKQLGRVLTIDEHVYQSGCSGKYGGKDHSSHCGRGGQIESNMKNTNKVAYEFAHMGNGGDPLEASLYVLRNDKLIDGNLIIQSVLASEKAMVFHVSAYKKNREAGLTGDLAPAIPLIHSRICRSPAMGQSILAS
uniref:Uncharacterized protein n=1 Tax=Solanum lycopersicum TaxID=4081 RepID=A0A3Q7G539_SOLLC